MSHGHCVGGKYSPEYNAWSAMIQRCTNPKSPMYADYGGRGIRVCTRWLSFDNFIADVGPRPSKLHTLDRFPNNDGNYEPGNVRWATRREQVCNRRNNRRLEAFGRVQLLSEWADEFGIPRNTLWYRLCVGMDLEQALSRARTRS